MKDFLIVNIKTLLMNDNNTEIYYYYSVVK